MLELVQKRVGDSTPVRISLFHALCEDECLAMEERAIELLHPVEVIRSEVSPVIGAQSALARSAWPDGRVRHPNNCI